MFLFFKSQYSLAATVALEQVEASWVPPCIIRRAVIVFAAVIMYQGV